ncbi:MAG: hypothetical protein Q4D41_09680 [Prevotellaceae bacterium]|nr:hypothetical protein [Prevotellaceae bacterium]
MKYIKQFISEYSLLLLLFGLVSCSGDDYEDKGDDKDDGLVSLTINIGTEDTSETRAYGGDSNAEAGEFMNTLVIFIVNSDGYVEKKINATTDTENFTPTVSGKGGCATSYTTTVEGIIPGTKTFYVFSNMDNVYAVGNTSTTIGDVLSGIKEGGTWSTYGIDSYVVSNPADGIDLSTKFIPMSVKATGSGTGTISLTLVRLVSKVNASLANNSGGDITINSFTMSSFADRVSLFDEYAATDIVYDKSYTISNISKTLANGATHTFEPFYRNETKGTSPFTVEVSVGDQTMTGTTSTTSIERNSILPLAMTLGNELYLTINAYIAPIGVLPITVYAKSTSDLITGEQNISVELPEGCTFSIEGSTQVTQDIAWNWVLADGTSAQDIQITSAATANPIEGYITAVSGKTLTLNYSVTSPKTVSGTLTITTKGLEDFDITQSSSSSAPMFRSSSLFRWCAEPSRYELVNLFDMK